MRRQTHLESNPVPCMGVDSVGSHAVSFDAGPLLTGRHGQDQPMHSGERSQIRLSSVTEDCSTQYCYLVFIGAQNTRCRLPNDKTIILGHDFAAHSIRHCLVPNGYDMPADPYSIAVVCITATRIPAPRHPPLLSLLAVMFDPSSIIQPYTTCQTTCHRGQNCEATV